MKSTLAQIVIRNIEFFELAPDSEIHPDSAVRQMEHIVDLLKQASKAELTEFYAVVEERLARLKATGGRPEHMDLLANLREQLGLDT